MRKGVRSDGVFTSLYDRYVLNMCLSGFSFAGGCSGVGSACHAYLYVYQGWQANRQDRWRQQDGAGEEVLPTRQRPCSYYRLDRRVMVVLVVLLCGSSLTPKGQEQFSDTHRLFVFYI